MANTAAQFGAILNGANQGSLVNQLFAGRQQTSTPQVAAASSVKNVNAHPPPQITEQSTPASIPEDADSAPDERCNPSENAPIPDVRFQLRVVQAWEKFVVNLQDAQFSSSRYREFKA